MKKEDLFQVKPKNIVCMLEVDGKSYCAFKDEEDSEYVNFGLLSELKDNIRLVSKVPERDLDKVLEEYDKYEELMTSEDELDEEDEGE